MNPERASCRLRRARSRDPRDASAAWPGAFGIFGEGWLRREKTAPAERPRFRAFTPIARNPAAKTITRTESIPNFAATRGARPVAGELRCGRTDTPTGRKKTRTVAGAGYVVGPVTIVWAAAPRSYRPGSKSRSRSVGSPGGGAARFWFSLMARHGASPGDNHSVESRSASRMLGCHP
jgi:hypothetical protein